MAALMTSRGLFGNLGHLSKILACQTQKVSYCRRKYSISIHSKCSNTKLLFNSCIQQSKRHFCEKQSRNPKRSNDEINKESTIQSDEKREEQKSSNSKYWKKIGLSVLVTWLSTTSGLLVYQWGKPFEDADGNPIEDEYSKYNVIYGYLMRTYREIFFQVKITQEPSRAKLLPDPLTYPYIQPPYTLVIELIDVLVHPEWKFTTGWRFKKRPGIDYFLRTVGPPTFEVVIFTKDSGMTADPIVTKIDPENFIMYRLYRDATRYQDGTHIKDLNCLNRDLSRVIMIDWNKEANKLNPDNGFSMKKWTGDMNDTALGELAEFLSAIAASKVDDVRPVLRYYNQFDNPMEQFHENQRKLKDEQERQFQAQQSRDSRSLTSIWNKLKT